ncbi:MAG: hypothetical protein KAS96_03480 [Planctomycetes bacterium]|nr:hypothetical protein [Planctomycetota bacterium]
MENQPQKQLYKYLLRNVAIFSAIWLYLWFIVDIKLIYHGAGRILDFPCFFKTSQFFFSHLSYPAGLLEYANAFVSQMFYFSPLGAAAITIVVWLSAVFIRNILTKVDLTRLSFLRFLPALIAVVTFSQYTYRFPFFIVMMVVLAFVSLYFSLKIKNLFLDLMVLLLLSVFLYVIAGPAILVFALLVLFYRLLNSYNFSVTIIFVVSALLIPYLIGVICFKGSLNNVYTELMPFSWKVTTIEPKPMSLVWMYILYFWLPAIIAGYYIYILVNNKLSNAAAEKKHFPKFAALKAKTVLLFKRSPVLKPILQIAFGLILFAGVYFFVFDSSRKILFQVDYYLAQRNWKKVISSAERFPTGSYYIVNSLNQALYHQGRLGEDMFAFPQHPFALFLSEKSHISIHWPKISLLMDLGFVNYVEHEVAESLEKFGSRPYLLKNMIISLLAKRNYATANAYLNQLSKTIFEHKWADDYIERLKTDPDLKNDQRIQSLRKNMPSYNHGFSVFPINDVLKGLLQKNPENKMAFEYLMTWYLLSGRIEKVVARFDIMNTLGYEKLPKYYQQAYLLHTMAMGQKASLKGYKIDPAVLKTSREAIGYFNMLRMGDEKALDTLSEKYSDTYIFYFISLPSIMQK